MSRDMYNIYVKLDTHALKVLLSKKKMAITGLEMVGTYFAKRDAERLKGQVTQIEAELRRREQQEPLF